MITIQNPDDGGENNRQFAATDKGNAERLVAHFGQSIRFVASTGHWHIYDGKRWERDETMVIREYAKRTANVIRSKAEVETAKWSKESESLRGINAMIELAKSDPSVVRTINDFDVDPLLINLQNGTLDLRNGELRRHSADDHFIRIANANFDPGAKCPRWLQFVEEITCGDRDLASYLQRIAGYFLSGLTSHQEFYILYGSGANGKSVLINALFEVLGDYATAADFKTFLTRRGDGPRNDLAALKGARLVCASEIGPGEHLDETVMKQVTGDDLISARFLYGEYFQYRSTFKVVLAANHLPRAIGTEEGIKRRLRILPCDATFREDQRDKGLVERLKDERDGILLWAVEGWVDSNANGWRTPPKVIALGRQYWSELDTLQQFIEDQCLIEQAAAVGAGELYQSYEAWCSEAAETAINKTLFGKKLTELGFGKRKSTKMMRLGLRLLTYEEVARREAA